MPSAVIRTYHYDAAQGRLDIVFTTGRRYSYHDVPPEVFARMKLSFSKGEFFNREIRDQFAYTRGA